jgi:ribokinase
LIARSSAIVLQLEMPLAAVRKALQLARKHGVLTILDPAPAPDRPLPADMFRADVFSPNQTEAQTLLRLSGVRELPGDGESVGQRLLALGARCVILKQGGAGATIIHPAGPSITVRPFKVRPVDTTAAGDAFTGALAVARVEGADWPEAVRFANAAGALCCTKEGAQPSLPYRAEVLRLLKGTR